MFRFKAFLKSFQTILLKAINYPLFCSLKNKGLITKESSLYLFLSIYVKNKNGRTNKVEKCLLFLKDYVEKSNLNIQVFLGDNNSDEEFRNWLMKNFANNKYFNLYFHTSNIGKAAIINLMWRQSDQQCEVVGSMDDDMQVTNESVSWIENCMITLNHEAVGLVSVDMLGHSCHVYKELTHSFEHNGMRLITNKHYTPLIGGGAFFMPKSICKTIEFYSKSENSIYGGDDAYLMKAVTCIGFLPVVNLNAKLYHPFPEGENESKYQQWKFDQSLK